MKNWHILYKTHSGEAISIGTVVSDQIPEGITSLALTDEQGDGLQSGKYIWDSKTKAIINAPLPKVTADEWLEKEGYGSTQLITLLDLQGKLIAAGKTSIKLNSVRAWTDGILASFVQDESPRGDWGSAPFTFSETVIDAFQQLK